MTDPLLPPNAPPPPVVSPPGGAPPPPPPKTSSGKGCWMAGCGGCLILLIVMFLAGFFVVRSMRDALNQPPFPPLEELTPAERATLETKKSMLESLEDETQPTRIPPSGLLVTAREINAWLIQENEEMADAVRISTEPDILRVQARVGEGRSRVAFEIAVSVVQVGDRLEMNIRDMRIGNFRVPRFIMKDLENEDLLRELFTDPQVRQGFSDVVERIEIREDGVLFVPRVSGM